MTTTSSFQIKPDYYNSKELCSTASREKFQTNPRYKYFKQTHFTAGDEEQFQQYRDATNGEYICIPNIPLNNNLFNLQPFHEWDGYKNLNSTAVLDTFRYMFNKFKKGIFVKIVNNRLRVFLPFSKYNFVNEWGDKIKVESGTIVNFLRNISRMEKRFFNENRVNNFTNTWYANNCLVRYEYPISEGDSNVYIIKNMLEELCEKRQIPDIEFFMNRRDFPLLTRNGTEPYYNIWDTIDQPLISHSYSKYVPIFSMSVTDHYADVLSPTHEDWARVQSFENIWFPKACRSYNNNFNTPWNDRKPTAVFRGGSTGCGVTIETNQRLKVAYLSLITPPDNNGIPYLDAGITNWNLRPRKLMGNQFLQTIEKDKLPFTLVSKLTPEQQAEYKYIINIDGHVTAFRLSLELNMGCVILLVKSPWKIWFSDMLIPYEHYVPVKEDLSDLISQIQWCRDNDDKCQIIVNNAKNFYNKYLMKDGILDYLQKRLVNLKSHIGIYLYNSISPLDYQISQEKNDLQSYLYPNTTKNVSDISEIPNIGRSYGLLQGIHSIVNMINNKSTFENIAVKGVDIFSNKLGIVRQFTIATFPFAVKTTTDSQKIKEHIHETYISIKCINNLLKQIPNFVYIFGMYQQENTYNVITEYIDGPTFDQYIKSSSFNFKEYLLILIQICLAIQVAQNSYGFVHYDLAPWNIIIQTLDKPTLFDYVISYDKVIRVRTNKIPIIIDFGKSHVIHENVHHGFINMYKTSTSQDIISLLLTSIDQILDRNYNLSTNDLNMLLKLSNFITNTQYRREKFTNTSSIKNFLNVAKKYTELISSNKYELEEKTPIDLVLYILKIDKTLKNEVGKTLTYNSSMNKGNSRQVFEYILSNTVEERAQTFLNVFSRLKHCTIPQPKNLFFIYYVAQTLEDNLISVRNNMMHFLENNNLNIEKYEKIFINTMRFLLKVYEPKISTITEKNVEYEIESDFSKLIIAPYDETTFLLPDKILSLLKPYKNEDLSDYKEIIEFILINQGRYKLLEKDRNYYLQNFSKLLSTNSFYMKNNNANIKTIRDVSKVLYNQDLIEIQNKIKNLEENCIDAQKYIRNYITILSFL
jgi:hypothetical protein